MEELRQKILDFLVAKHRYAENDIVEAEVIANELNVGVDYVNEELEKMGYLGLIKVYGTFGPKYSAQITPKGLLFHEQIGKD